MSRFRQMDACRRYILDALLTAAEHREDGWVERERRAVALAASEWAVIHGQEQVTVDEVEQVEGLAVGHVDYAEKLALYVTELVYGARTVEP
jgi:hypothetical protein